MDLPRPTHVFAVILAFGFTAAACAAAEEPELVAVAATPTPDPTPTAPPAPEPTAAAAASPTAPAATSTPVVVPARTRGITDDTIRIGVIKSGSVFGDVELGVRARLHRLNANGGAAGRSIELAVVIDDGGDPAQAAAAGRTLVEDEEVFAVILATAVPDPELTDYLAEQHVPFFGWGFASGFCAPNAWGFGFNGCLIGAILGLADARPDVSARELTAAFYGRPATVVFVTGDDDAGTAGAFQAERVWGEQLLDVVRLAPDADGARDAIDAAVAAANPDIILLALGLEETVELKGGLISSFDGMVLDNVSYLPGLLGDFAVADRLEGGYSVTQFPPQEEYRPVTAVIATDLDAVGGALIYSQAVSLGYWSADLLAELVEAVGTELDTATFFQTVNVDGVEYAPESAGAPCAMNTLDIHTSPAGGAALVRVEGGIYRPVVEFSCFS